MCRLEKPFEKLYFEQAIHLTNHLARKNLPPNTEIYRGRFAPSPTGFLHEGSLLTAVASFLDAKKSGGKWFLRIEDIDPLREKQAYINGIIRSLAAFGFEWDGEIIYQSQRYHLYQQALDYLIDSSIAYPCNCSRKQIAKAPALIDNFINSEHCQICHSSAKNTSAWRARVPDAVFYFDDYIQGRYQQNLASDIGNFILRRTDGSWAYQLAAVVDDAEQGVNHILRGADLLSSTPRQLCLQNYLGFKAPKYAHLPLILNFDGQKLSKHNKARAFDEINGLSLLRKILTLLGQNPEPAGQNLDELWQWAQQNWQLSQVPKYLPHE